MLTWTMRWIDAHLRAAMVVVMQHEELLVINQLKKKINLIETAYEVGA